jgi:hypothetical protein
MDRWSSEIGTAEDIYLGQRLAYRESSAEGDIAFGRHQGVLPLLVRTWLIATFLWLIVSAFLSLGGVFERSAEPSGFSTVSESETVLRWDILCALWLLCFVVAGMVRERQWASQWQYVLDDQAPAAEAAYGCIVETIQRRQLPVATSHRAIRSDLGGDTRWYLVLRFREYSAYVGVFSFGTSLYMSWSMWREEWTLGVFWRCFIETVSGSSHVQQIIRADPARAMRDAVHNAVREGLEAATTGQGPSIHDALRGNFPILEPAPGEKGPEVASAPPPGAGPPPSSAPTYPSAEAFRAFPPIPPSGPTTR